MTGWLVNGLLKRWPRLAGRIQTLPLAFKSGAAENLLYLLLNVMRLEIYLSRKFRRSIEGFEATYLFRTRDSRVKVTAVFAENRLHVSKRVSPHPSITIIFRNPEALLKYLLSAKPDVIGSIIRQDVQVEGNLNYLFKFAYLAKRLQLALLRKL